ATIFALSTTTGSVTSMTTRILPGAESPPRNDLTSPAALPSGSIGSRSFTSGSSTTTRLGSDSADTWNATGRSRPTTNRVAVGNASAAVAGARAAAALAVSAIIAIGGADTPLSAWSGRANPATSSPAVANNTV